MKFEVGIKFHIFFITLFKITYILQSKVHLLCIQHLLPGDKIFKNQV